MNSPIINDSEAMVNKAQNHFIGEFYQVFKKSISINFILDHRKKGKILYCEANIR